MRELKILAINVCLRPYMNKILFPLGLAYIVSAIHRAGYNLEILDLDRHRKTDEELRQILKEKDFNVVAFGCVVSSYKIIKNLAKMIREAKKDAIIIAGNSVADSIPKILLEKTEVDVAVIGEGELTIVEILDKLKKEESLKDIKGIWYKEKGKIIANPMRTEVLDINNIPFPEWGLFDMEAYIKSASEFVSEPYPMPKEKIRAFIVNTGRGCPFRCTFCYQVFQDYKFRPRPIDAVLAEIKELQEQYGINYLMFNDDLSLYSKKQSEEFADKILAQGIKFFWTGNCRVGLFNLEEDIKILKKLKKAGLIGLEFSLESGNKEILKEMKKGIQPEDFIKQKRLLDKAGLITWTSLVIGYPQETKETIKETMDICYEAEVYPTTGYLLPQPRTPIYDYMLKSGAVKDEEQYLLLMGDRQDLRINLTKMSDEEMQNETKKHLMRISNKLNLGLTYDRLIKTGIYKHKKDKK